MTVVTHERECLFGEVVDGEMVLSDFGRIAVEQWERTAVVRPYVRLDVSVVMPNHFHGIIWIVNDDGVVGAQRRCAPTDVPNVLPRSLGAIVRGFKSAVTYHINHIRNTPGAPVWQRNYYERIIRDERELNATREYILNNPANWSADSEYAP